MEKRPNPLAAAAEPAALMTPPSRRRAQRNRRWESDHPATSYRLDPSTKAGIEEIRAHYLAAGYDVNLSEVADDLLQWAIDEWSAGRVPIHVRAADPIRIPQTKFPPAAPPAETQAARARDRSGTGSGTASGRK
jgi:DNA-directed RNA polymerase subunit K/omega